MSDLCRACKRPMCVSVAVYVTKSDGTGFPAELCPDCYTRVRFPVARRVLSIAVPILVGIAVAEVLKTLLLG
jgi:hypothetical protein